MPLGISAFGGEFLDDANLANFEELSRFTPGLVGSSTDSFIDLLQCRGIYTFDFGVGGDPSISVFKNGLYQGRNGPVVTSQYDIDRVEIARGPQGFLFGRNSIAGAINTITRHPEIGRTVFAVGAEVGQYGHAEFDGVWNAPMGETGAARIAAYVARDDGYATDGFAPARGTLVLRDAEAVRVSLRNRTDVSDINLMVEYEDRQRSGTVYRAIERGGTWETLNELFDVDVPGGPYDSGGDLRDGEADDLEVLSVGLEIERDLGWATFTSLTGYRDHKYFYAEDYDGSPLRVNHYHQDQAGDYAEQELRLVSDEAGEGPLSWYAGVSLYREDIHAAFTTFSDEDVLCAYYNYYGYATCQDYYAYLGYEFAPNPEGLVEPNEVSGRYSGWAAYVDLNLALSETLDVGVGVRHTADTKEFANWAPDVDSDLGPYLTLGFTSTGFLRDERTWSETAPRAFVRFRPNEEWTWFASATRGYKAGGFGSFALSPPPPWPTVGVGQGEAAPDPFGPEESLSLRSRLYGEVREWPRADEAERVLVHFRGPAGDRAGAGRELRRRQRGDHGRQGRGVGVGGVPRPVSGLACGAGLHRHGRAADARILRGRFVRRQRPGPHARLVLRRRARGRASRRRRALGCASGGVRAKRGVRRAVPR